MAGKQRWVERAGWSGPPTEVMILAMREIVQLDLTSMAVLHQKRGFALFVVRIETNVSDLSGEDGKLLLKLSASKASSGLAG